MGTYEATSVVVARINKLDPENASKIIGHILVNLQDTELVRLASSPDYVLHNLVLRIKNHLGLSSAPSSPSTLSHIPRHPNSTNPFSRFSGGNPSSPSSHASPVSGLPNNPISPKSSFSLSHDSIFAGSVPKSCLSPRVTSDYNAAGGDFVDEQQMGEYLSFLNESLKDEDLADPRLELGHGVVNNGDGHFHRRSHSASDVCFGPEEVGIGYKPCLYFARGFCKNGSNCKFVHHGALTDAADGGAIVGSPSRFEGLEQREEIIRLKALQHQRLMAASQLMDGAAPSSYDKYINFLMPQENDLQRAAAAAAAAVMLRDEFCRFGRCRPERHDFLGVTAEKPNSPSRQIYLTFPAESTFKDEDVSVYFSKFGPVQDVRIPYQQKRMFGFVTFVYPETVRLILSKGNPHFICDSRVLVKPYKEKGKTLDKRQQHQQPHLERGEFSPCLSPSGVDSKASYDFHLGPRMSYNPHEILLRRKLEEQAELQQAIELQERRLMNLHLPDLKNNHFHHHQRSLSFGASLPLSQLHGHVSDSSLYSDSIKGDITGFSGNLVSTMSSAAAAAEQQQSQQEVDSPCIQDNYSRNGTGSIHAEIIDLQNSVEHALPDSLSASPTKAAGDNHSDFSTLAEVNESAVLSTCSPAQNKLEPQSTLSDMASH